LKIRTENGKRTLHLKVLYSEKIGSLYDIINNYSEMENFEIWGGYPPHALPNDPNKTLKDYEITEDSRFNLRSKVPPK